MIYDDDIPEELVALEGGWLSFAVLPGLKDLPFPESDPQSEDEAGLQEERE